MWRRPGACTIAALLAWENRGQRAWAARPVSAMGDLSASRRSPRLRFASGTARLWRGPEAVGRADAMIETSHTRASIAEKGGRVPRALRKAALSEKTSMYGGVVLPCKATSLQGWWGRGGVLVKPSHTWHNTLESVCGWPCQPLPKTKWPWRAHTGLERGAGVV